MVVRRIGKSFVRVAPSVAPDRARRFDALLLVTTSGLHRYAARTTACPDPSSEPDCCRISRQTGSVQGRRSRSRSDAERALDRFRLT